MSKRKSIFVTALLAILIAALDACMFKINMIAFAIITGALALYGYIRSAADFSGWLNKEPSTEEHALELPSFERDDPPSFTCESIIDEIMKEEGKA